MPLVELHNVSKTYNHAAAPVRALAEASLEIAEREFVALMGPSGSGKSTILSILGAMNPPTSGRVVVDGLDIYGLSIERLADFRREYLGFVFQQLFLVPYLTAAENVMLPLAAARMPNRRQLEMASDALGRVGLADKMTRLPRDLSGGEQQRVAIARAIVNAPPLLLADEPTGCLDSRTGREIVDLFQRLRDDGLTVFLVTHDSAVAARADRIVHVQDGRVVDGVPEAISLTA
jgi:putative ABC transport system ATP-binding protein